jgi:hypothetical protein
MLPDVGLSMHPRRLSIVVLPQPEGPTMAVNSPASTERLTFLSARIVVRPSE